MGRVNSENCQYKEWTAFFILESTTCLNSLKELSLFSTQMISCILEVNTASSRSAWCCNLVFWQPCIFDSIQQEWWTMLHHLPIHQQKCWKWHQLCQICSYKSHLELRQDAQWSVFPRSEMYPLIGRNQSGKHWWVVWFPLVQIKLQDPLWNYTNLRFWNR